jgi:transcriptional regulator GlxA family with amidase domain
MLDTRWIALFIFPDADEMDIIGPWEVLTQWTRGFPEDGWGAYCVSLDGRPVTCSKGLTFEPHYGLSDMPAPEIFLHPGGQGTRPMLEDQEHLDRIRDLRGKVPLMASVCTGALVYAGAGLLSGRPATTHWASIELLGELDPTIDVRPDERFVDDGDLVSSAGVSAGIDMALHLVRRFGGVERAKHVRKHIQYDPQPPV